MRKSKLEPLKRPSMQINNKFEEDSEISGEE